MFRKGVVTHVDAGRNKYMVRPVDENGVTGDGDVVEVPGSALSLRKDALKDGQHSVGDDSAIDSATTYDEDQDGNERTSMAPRSELGKDESVHHISSASSGELPNGNGKSKPKKRVSKKKSGSRTTAGVKSASVSAQQVEQLERELEDKEIDAEAMASARRRLSLLPEQKDVVVDEVFSGLDRKLLMKYYTEEKQRLAREARLARK